MSAPAASHTLPSDEALRLIAGYFAALSDPCRLRLVRALMEGQRNVGELVTLSGCRQSTVSRHLGRLAAAGLVQRCRHGPHVYYSIADDSLHTLCANVCGALEKRHARDAACVAGR